MNDITISNTVTMTSLQISELVEKRHDNVKRTIETLAQQGVIELPQIEEFKTATKPMQVFLFSGERGKRDSIIVVAQLSPEFTARLVDRWQQLEQQIAFAALPDFTSPAIAARAWAEQVERVETLALENKTQAEALREAEPKIQALERFANHDGKHTLRSACKQLGLPEHKLKTWLLCNRWYYRDHAGRLCAYADKIQAGYLDTISHEIPRSEGIQVVQQPVITQKGMVKLAVLLVRDGLSLKEAA